MRWRRIRQADPDTPSVQAAADPAQMSPADLGDAIGTLYVEAIGAVTEELGPRPEPEALRPKLETMKEGYVSKLVAYGRAREAMAEADRATVDSKIGSAMMRVPNETWTAYSEGQQHYFSSDSDLADLIASFNVITQYANFDLLEKQEPDEAKRLGIH